MEEIIDALPEGGFHVSHEQAGADEGVGDDLTSRVLVGSGNDLFKLIYSYFKFWNLLEV